jgi:PilZ domain
LFNVEDVHLPQANEPLAEKARPGERRSAARYGVALPVTYTVVRDSAICATGRGRTVDLSTSGILLAADRPLPDGEEIHLSIEWPSASTMSLPVSLYVGGRIVRNQGLLAAVRLLRYEFRTAHSQERV